MKDAFTNRVYSPNPSSFSHSASSGSLWSSGVSSGFSSTVYQTVGGRTRISTL